MSPELAENGARGSDKSVRRATAAAEGWGSTDSGTQVSLFFHESSRIVWGAFLRQCVSWLPLQNRYLGNLSHLGEHFLNLFYSLSSCSLSSYYAPDWA